MQTFWICSRAHLSLIITLSLSLQLFDTAISTIQSSAKETERPQSCQATAAWAAAAFTRRAIRFVVNQPILWSVASSKAYKLTRESTLQRNDPKSVAEQGDRYKEGQPHSHLAQDSKDERSIANKLGREAKREREVEPEKSQETLESKKDSTLPVRHRGRLCVMIGLDVC